MLRLLHTADVHLGARHADMGEHATAQRERQFAAFQATVDLALAEKVDLFLVAGDLFDSNTQPRRSVERVAAQLARLSGGAIRVVIIPGTHDVYDRASIYRAYDLAKLAATAAGTTPAPFEDAVAILSSDRPSVAYPALDAVVYGRVFDTKRAPRSPLAGFALDAEARATWHIGLIHGALLIPGRTEHDEVVFTKEEVAASGLDYLALGHWHSTSRGTAGTTLFAYSGAPEPVAIDQDRAGSVLLVTLDEHDGAKSVTAEERRVGRTRFARIEVDVAPLHSQPALVTMLSANADPDLVLDVRLTGVLPDDLDIEVDEVERELEGSFFGIRVRDESVPAMPEGPLPSGDTIAGAFVRDLEARIAVAAASTGPRSTAGGSAGASGGSLAEGAGDEGELRDVLRLGRLLLDGREVTL